MWTRVLRTRSLEWYYNNVKSRFKSFGSAKVLKTLYRKHIDERGSLSLSDRRGRLDPQVDSQVDPQVDETHRLAIPVAGFKASLHVSVHRITEMKKAGSQGASKSGEPAGTLPHRAASPLARLTERRARWHAASQSGEPAGTPHRAASPLARLTERRGKASHGSQWSLC
ncbi:unnamed protein product [Arctogadus glacialis]